jgi:hypothetical protein
MSYNEKLEYLLKKVRELDNQPQTRSESAHQLKEGPKLKVAATHVNVESERTCPKSNDVQEVSFVAQVLSNDVPDSLQVKNECGDEQIEVTNAIEPEFHSCKKAMVHESSNTLIAEDEGSGGTLLIGNLQNNRSQEFESDDENSSKENDNVNEDVSKLPPQIMDEIDYCEDSNPTEARPSELQGNLDDMIVIKTQTEDNSLDCRQPQLMIYENEVICRVATSISETPPQTVETTPTDCANVTQREACLSQVQEELEETVIMKTASEKNQLHESKQSQISISAEKEVMSEGINLAAKEQITMTAECHQDTIEGAQTRLSQVENKSSKKGLRLVESIHHWMVVNAMLFQHFILAFLFITNSHMFYPIQNTCHSIVDKLFSSCFYSRNSIYRTILHDLPAVQQTKNKVFERGKRLQSGLHISDGHKSKSKDLRLEHNALRSASRLQRVFDHFCVWYTKQKHNCMYLSLLFLLILLYYIRSSFVLQTNNVNTRASTLPPYTSPPISGNAETIPRPPSESSSESEQHTSTPRKDKRSSVLTSLFRKKKATHL